MTIFHKIVAGTTATLLAVTPAFASGGPGSSAEANSGSVSGAASTSTAGAIGIGGTAQQSQGQMQGQMLTNTNGASASTGPVTANPTATSSLSGSQSAGASIVTNSTTDIPYQAPQVFTAPPNNTADCVISKGGGLSIPWGGVSFSGGKVQEGCEARALIQLTGSIAGRPVAAAMMCMRYPEVLAAYQKLGIDCYKQSEPAPVVAAPVVAPTPPESKPDPEVLGSADTLPVPTFGLPKTEVSQAVQPIPSQADSSGTQPTMVSHPVVQPLASR